MGRRKGITDASDYNPHRAYGGSPSNQFGILGVQPIGIIAGLMRLFERISGIFRKR